MAQNCGFRFGPIALTATNNTNILNPGTLTGGVVPVAAAASNFQSSRYVNSYISLRHIRIVNQQASAITYQLYIGGTGANAAGTEFMGRVKSIAANSVDDWYAGAPGLRLDMGDFLVGSASVNGALTVQGEGEIGVA